MSLDVLSASPSPSMAVSVIVCSMLLDSMTLRVPLFLTLTLRRQNHCLSSIGLALTDCTSCSVTSSAACAHMPGR
jgi:hypothetical protein